MCVAVAMALLRTTGTHTEASKSFDCGAHMLASDGAACHTGSSRQESALASAAQAKRMGACGRGDVREAGSEAGGEKVATTLPRVHTATSSSAAAATAHSCTESLGQAALDVEEKNTGDGGAGAGGCTKEMVRQALARVCQCYSAARPTRGSLKQVFQFVRQIQDPRQS